MREQQKNNRISAGVVAAVSAAVVAVGGGVAWLTWHNNHSIPQNTTSETIHPSTQASKPPTTSNQQNTNIYLLKDTGKNFELVPQQVQVATADNPQQILKAGFQKLLTQSTQGEDFTTIPKGTKLLGLKVGNDGIHVNLSSEFTGSGGGTSVMGRVGQVVYTATSLDPKAKVYIEVNGKLLDVLGGEGLELEQPLTRESFQKNYSL